MRIFHLHRGRKGVVASLEFLLNILLYFPIFLLLFQMSLIPLQQFYLTQAARSGALVYIQIKHYSGGSDVPNIIQQMGINNILDTNNVITITTQFIKNEFELSSSKNALPGKLFNPAKIVINYLDSEDEITNNLIGRIFARCFSTQQVTVTVRYPFTLLKVFNLSFGTFYIEGKFTVMYNP